jgi:PPOX class probable FMN-dependent enzyme
LTDTSSYQITDLQALERLYGTPAAASLKKEVDFLHPHYQAFIRAAPFVALASNGPDGLDVSPRGDPAGFVHVEDEKTLLLPDRRGNNRIDSLRNIIADRRVALLFLIPGIGETLRVNGRAAISVDPELLARFALDGKEPRSVLRVRVEKVFFQCSRAILRSRLWDPSRQLDRSALPSIGTILKDLSGGEIDGQKYDAELPERLKSTMY